MRDERGLDQSPGFISFDLETLRTKLGQIAELEKLARSLPPYEEGVFDTSVVPPFNKIMGFLQHFLNEPAFKEFVYETVMSGDRKMPQAPYLRDVNRTARLLSHLNLVKEYLRKILGLPREKDLPWSEEKRLKHMEQRIEAVIEKINAPLSVTIRESIIFVWLTLPGKDPQEVAAYHPSDGYEKQGEYTMLVADRKFKRKIEQKVRELSS